VSIFNRPKFPIPAGNALLLHGMESRGSEKVVIKLDVDLNILECLLEQTGEARVVKYLVCIFDVVALLVCQ
jgi:hypothetical protein